MEHENEYISRPVRIKLKDSEVTIVGVLVFNEEQTRYSGVTKLFTTVKFRLNDTEKAELLINMIDINMIYYL